MTLEQTLYNAFVKSEVHTRRKAVGWEYSEYWPSSLRAKKRRKEPQQPSSLHLRETESSVGAGRVWENTTNRGTEEGGGATRWAEGSKAKPPLMATGTEGAGHEWGWNEILNVAMRTSVLVEKGEIRRLTS